MSTLDLGTPYANGRVLSIDEWNNTIFGAIETRVNDITFDQVSTSLAIDEDDMASDSSSHVPTQQSTKKYVDNNVDNLGITVDNNRILSGPTNTDGFPAFLASGTGNEVIINASAGSAFAYWINGASYSITSNISVSGLALASAGVSATVSSTYYASASAFSKTEGEYGDTTINVCAVASAISAADGTVQAFFVNSEYILATVESVDADQMILKNSKRGVGLSDRGTLTNADTLYMLQQNNIFLSSDGITTYTTSVYPKFLDSDPASGTIGEFYFNNTDQKWYRYSGAAWVDTGVVWLGTSINDSVGTVVAIDIRDFDISWDSNYNVDISYKSASTIDIFIKSVSVGAKNIAGALPLITLDLSAAGDRETGVAEANSTIYYIYLDKFGKARFSDICPRDKDNKKGFYHPRKYWRCIGTVYNDASGNILPFLMVGDKYVFTTNGTGAADQSISAPIEPSIFSALTTSYALFEAKFIPPYVSAFMAQIGYDTTRIIYQKERKNTYGNYIITVVSSATQISTELFVQNSTVITRSSSAGAAYCGVVSMEVKY